MSVFVCVCSNLDAIFINQTAHSYTVDKTTREVCCHRHYLTAKTSTATAVDVCDEGRHFSHSTERAKLKRSTLGLNLKCNPKSVISLEGLGVLKYFTLNLAIKMSLKF
jgi:microcystin-dependent protein